jgi:Pvc16 N-terminal domain
MIDVALNFLVGELNKYVLQSTGSTFGQADICKPVDETGKWAIADDRIGASILNIEEERIDRWQLPETRYVGNTQVLLQPPLKLNLHVIFAAHFKHYGQALKHLSLVLTFFQAHASFGAEEYPALDPRIEKLTLEMQSLNYEQLNQVWAVIGGKQLPSAIYKMRAVVLQDVPSASVQPPIITVTTALHQ